MTAHQGAVVPAASGPDAEPNRGERGGCPVPWIGDQQSIAVCSDCVLPFVTGGAGPAALAGAAGPAGAALQTMVGDVRSVVSRLGPADAVGASAGMTQAAGLTQLDDLKQQCASLAATTGSSPVNIDRSGPVVPFTEQSPVKSADLAAAASAALPESASSAGIGITVTRSQLAAAVQSAQAGFAKVSAKAVVQSCKPLADLEFRRVYSDGSPIANLPYTVTLADGSKRSGTTDGSGMGSHSGVPPGAATVVYGQNKNPRPAAWARRPTTIFNISSA